MLKSHLKKMEATVWLQQVFRYGKQVNASVSVYAQIAKGSANVMAARYGLFKAAICFLQRPLPN